MDGVVVLGSRAVLVLEWSRVRPPAARAGGRRQVVAVGTGQAFGVRIVEGQGVEREMVGLEGERGVERLDPVDHGRVRGVVEQVEADRGDAGGARLGDGPDHVDDPMPSTQPPERCRGHRLGADRQPGDADSAKRGGVAPLIGSGIGLQGDLGAIRDAEPGPNPIDQLADGRRREQRRRPAAEVDRLERRPPAAERRVKRVRAQVELGKERRNERGDACLRSARRRPGVDHEVAVRTERDAERDMDVERDRRRRLTHG